MWLSGLTSLSTSPGQNWPTSRLFSITLILLACNTHMHTHLDKADNVKTLKQPFSYEKCLACMHTQVASYQLQYPPDLTNADRSHRLL